MQPPLTPRDIQMRIRSGESLADVIAEAGMSADRVEGFAAPILAERSHIIDTALSCAVRRQGETVSGRRLRQTVAESLLDTGHDIEDITWDSWRRSDGRWIIQGVSSGDSPQLRARFLYDPRGRFSVAENDPARLLIGDAPLRSPTDLSNETTDQVEQHLGFDHSDLDEEPTVGLSPHEDEESTFSGYPEDSLRNDIDSLYDMISTIDEDSVRIFRGLRESPTLSDSPSPDQPSLLGEVTAEPVRQLRGGDLPPPPVEVFDSIPAGEGEFPPTKESKKTRSSRKRASVPAWDDIIFGGKS
ncbi:MAG: septation protein SepH [Propionibacteriaceae bacterium]|nr:septation protein SepH [Propionibacteriaceae bacterium]